MAEPRRDAFPNNYVGDLVPTDRGWVVVPPRHVRTWSDRGRETRARGSRRWCSANGKPAQRFPVNRIS